MKANKVLAMTLAMAMTAGMLAGCGSSEKEVKETKKVEDSASEGEQITLNYWTWFPSKDQIQETVDAFEKEVQRKILMLLEFSRQHLQKKFRIIWQIWMN